MPAEIDKSVNPAPPEMDSQDAPAMVPPSSADGEDKAPAPAAATPRTLADLPFPTDLPLLSRQDLEVGAMLGKGRFSQVHAVKGPGLQDETTGQKEVVMKHIQSKLFAKFRSNNSGQQQQRGGRRATKELTNAIADLVTEAMYLTKMRGQHDHIVTLRGLTRGGTRVLKQPGAVGADYFLLLDRMEDTLDQRIQLVWNKQYQTYTEDKDDIDIVQPQLPRQPLSLVMDKVRYAWQIASALSFLHDHQIVYRDLKPENVGFLREDNDKSDDTTSTPTWKCQLFDFGLARELEEPVTNDKRLYKLSASGTRRYMAPEIFNPPGRYNYKVDVYSWAMVLYEMTSQLKPFALFTGQLHEELVCRLGGRPRMKEILWPHECCSSEDDNNGNDLAKALETLMHQAWAQNLFERLTMAQVCDRLQEILQQHASVVAVAEEREQRLSAHLQSLNEGSTSSAGSKGLMFDSGSCDGHQEGVAMFRKKTSNSEMTVATFTESMASDSELDDDHPKARWSETSARSSISSKGTLLVGRD